MIISNEYKYIFIEIARTGSTAIGKELILNYKGKKLYEKHTNYIKLRKSNKKSELFKEYYLFSTVRNPIDRAVSIFYSLESNIIMVERKLKKEKRYLKKIMLRLLKRYYTKRYSYAKKVEFDFSKYFKRYLLLAYVDSNVLHMKKANRLLRFENLNEDFKKALKELGINPVRDLPKINKTKNRLNDFTNYYDQKIIKSAKKYFCVYMKYFGYEYPEEWGEYKCRYLDKIKFSIKKLLMEIFWYCYY